MSERELVFDYLTLISIVMRDHNVLLVLDPYPDLSTDQALIEYIQRCLDTLPLSTVLSTDTIETLANYCIEHFKAHIKDDASPVSALKIRILVILNMLLRLLDKQKELLRLRDKQKELVTVEIDGDDAVH